MSYARQAARHYDEQRLGQQKSDYWTAQNLNVDSANAARNWETDAVQFISAASPIFQEQFKKYQAQQEYNARIEQLMDPAGLAVAGQDDFIRWDSKEEHETNKTNLQNVNLALDNKYDWETASLLDLTRNRRKQGVIATQFVNQTTAGLAPFVENQILNSGLVFTRKDGSKLDLSLGFLNAEDHALVTQYFTQEYLKATRLLDLNPGFLKSLKVDESINKTQATLQANWSKAYKQQKSYEDTVVAQNTITQEADKLRENLRAREKAIANNENPNNEKMEVPEEYVIDWDPIMLLLRQTYNPTTGKRRTFSEVQKVIWDHAENVAKVHTGDGRMILDALRAGSYTGHAGTPVGFSKSKLDSLDELIVKEAADNTETKYKRHNLNQEAANQLLLDGVPEKDILEQYPDVDIEQGVAKLFFATNLADPKTEAQEMRYNAEVLGIFPSPDDLVNGENEELKKTLMNDGRSYYGRNNNKKYKEGIQNFDVLMKSVPSVLGAYGEIVKLDAIQMKRIATEKLDAYILKNHKRLGLDGAIEQGVLDITAELEKIQTVDDLVKHKWMIEAKKGRDEVSPLRIGWAIEQARNNNSSIDLTKPLVDDGVNDVSNWAFNLSDNERTSIIDHAFGNTNVGAPTNIKRLRKAINQSRPRRLGTVTDQEVSQWIVNSLGITGKTDTNKDVNLISEVREKGENPGLIYAYDNSIKYPSFGSTYNLGIESFKTLGMYDKVLLQGAWDALNLNTQKEDN